MKKMIIPIVITITITSGCSKDDGDGTLIKKENIAGLVQKGPFISGTSISVNELNTDLSQTGKSYNTQITDARGSFEINNVELVSGYVSLRADGFYFNEILGDQSIAQLTLYALSDLSDKSTVNVNILSNLEKSRVEYLVSHGTNFQGAKNQALNEILGIFKFHLSDGKSSELLDITKEGEDNAVLLASSVILQGYRTESELTALLSNISSDICEDGILDDSLLGSQLINHAVYLDTTAIRDNLEKRYTELKVEVEIPHFEKFILEFINNTDFDISESLIEYPESGQYGPNILDLTRFDYSGGDSSGSQFSLAASLAKNTELKIKITALGSGDWMYALGSSVNWSVSQFDLATRSQTFTVIDSDKDCDLLMLFFSGEFLVEYFEMGLSEPTKTKIFTVQ